MCHEICMLSQIYILLLVLLYTGMCGNIASVTKRHSQEKIFLNFLPFCIFLNFEKHCTKKMYNSFRWIPVLFEGVLFVLFILSILFTVSEIFKNSRLFVIHLICICHSNIYNGTTCIMTNWLFNYSKFVLEVLSAFEQLKQGTNDSSMHIFFQVLKSHELQVRMWNRRFFEAI